MRFLFIAALMAASPAAAQDDPCQTVRDLGQLLAQTGRAATADFADLGQKGVLVGLRGDQDAGHAIRSTAEAAIAELAAAMEEGGQIIQRSACATR